MTVLKNTYTKQTDILCYTKADTSIRDFYFVFIECFDWKQHYCAQTGELGETNNGTYSKIIYL